MAYKAIVDFKDIRTGICYKAGDTYPKSGTVTTDRAEQLMTPTSQRGPLIEEITEVEKKKSKKSEGKAEKAEQKED